MSKQQVKNILSLPRLALLGHINSGYCHVCQKRTLFLKTGEWLRDQYICFFCHSIPRQRALIRVLEAEFPRWRELRIHESSPCGPASDMIQKQCPGYLGSQYFPDVPSGSCRDGFQCENLENMSFADGEFDLVITQDVFEHVLRPDHAFSEICRTLKAGGAHLFTVPVYRDQKTVTRAVASPDGIQCIMEPIYHSNPVDSTGSLVVSDWGDDITEFIASVCDMDTTIFQEKDINFGIDGEFLDVLISRKSPISMEGSP